MNIQIKDFFGEVLFEYDKENNTVKDTVVEAIKQGVNLINANLCGADLNYANLYGANLWGANLKNADLRHVDLSYADLKDAELRYADLYGADLYGADLYGADLRGATLYDANLRHANLINADLRNANLRYAKLSYGDLENADLGHADLYGANLLGVKNIPSIPLVCPSEGSFIGWKKISDYKENYEGEFLVKLLIPEDAKRSSATTNKCRCDKAKVLEITNIDDGSTVDIITNSLWTNCVYKVGEIVYPDSFEENRWDECSNGIHFFMDKEEAINY